MKNIFIESSHNNFKFRRFLVKIDHEHLLLQFFLVETTPVCGAYYLRAGDLASF